MADKHTVQVTIFHQTYTLRTSGDEEEVQQLADTVDRLMSAIAARSASADSLRIAVLACLHLADRLRSIENELAQLRQRVEEKSERFRLLLDQALEGR
ncbi:MAG TPA: cell division protein ZapA [Bryobacteraceae bacterium]|nr:cell division protein ZapA [Bryobacteraceae bacterium]HOL72538.1 cell division protein ZapA [Bryobacteraceae bacterium]HOQ46410.1 cell division protein ZapA [Bryobacteraceae bacterium]HPQ16518.1 cell division protein ZapA [Bryobacteraceae bacterium]HPU72571.1 cell division protein ZapA [Bryobacteraceae bacterium]